MLIGSAVALAVLGGALSGGLPAGDGRRDAPRAAEAGALPAYVFRDSYALGPSPLRKTPKLDTHLDLLHRIDVLARARGGGVSAASADLPVPLRSAIDARQIRLDDGGAVQVYAESSGDVARTADDLRVLGMDVEIVSDEYALVQGRLPVSALEAASELDSVQRIRPPGYGFVDTGSVMTEGDAILDANDLRATYGVNGTTVRVGVISDGLEGLTAAQTSGDLPAVINTTTCDFAPGLPTDPGAGAEGTAMLEIIHDIAPGAELWFGFFQTDLEFISAVDCLADNVDVIVDDLSFFNVGLYDGTSTISQNLTAEMNDAGNRVRAYHKSVGNQALNHYQEAYVDADPSDGNNEFHVFSPTASTTDQMTIGPQLVNPIFLVNNGIVVIHLQWNDPFATSSNDYDMYMFQNSDGLEVASSIGEQSGSQPPTEIIVFQNTTGMSRFYDIAIYKFDGATRTFDMFVPRCDCIGLPLPGGPTPVLNFNTASSSVPNNGDATGIVVTHGAIDAVEPGNDLIEPYSSRGPTNSGLTKPEITSIDGVAVTGAGGFGSPFFGTSAAAPHGGGIAALILSCAIGLKHGEGGDNPVADRNALRNAMFNSAVDLGTAGNDNTYGRGRLDADGAAALAGCSTDVDGDTVLNTADNCVYVSNLAQTNTDAGIPQFPGADALGDACDDDDDGDGCNDTEETGLNVALGGGRNPLIPWDFADVPTPALPAASAKNKAITIQDVGSTLSWVGRSTSNGTGPDGRNYVHDNNANGVADGSEYDRTPAVPFSGPPNGAITLQDVGVVLGQVGHSCAAPPN